MKNDQKMAKFIGGKSLKNPKKGSKTVKTAQNGENGSKKTGKFIGDI